MSDEYETCGVCNGAGKVDTPKRGKPSSCTGCFGTGQRRKPKPATPPPTTEEEDHD